MFLEVGLVALRLFIDRCSAANTSDGEASFSSISVPDHFLDITFNISINRKPYAIANVDSFLAVGMAIG